MEHEEQNDPVAQSFMSKSLLIGSATTTADSSEGDNKEKPVVREEEIDPLCLARFLMAARTDAECPERDCVCVHVLDCFNSARAGDCPVAPRETTCNGCPINTTEQSS